MRPGVQHANFAAIVIGHRPWRESDRIVDLLTVEHGRISAVARAARSSRRRFQGALELFSSLHVLASARRALWHLESAEIVDARIGLRRSLETIQQASLLADAARALTVEGDAAAAAFCAVGAGLDDLNRGDLCASVSAWPALLKAVGIFPDLAGCGRCGAAELTHWTFSSHFVALCAACGVGEARLVPAALAVLRGHPCGDRAAAAEVTALCVRWIEAHLVRPLASAAVLAVDPQTRRPRC
jgi:DNA repair protein RecO (recombination protein O)